MEVAVGDKRFHDKRFTQKQHASDSVARGGGTRRSDRDAGSPILYGSCLESKKLGGGFNFLKLTSFQGVRRGYETGMP